MTPKTENMQPLDLKDCEILHIATGVRAQNIKQLREALVSIHPDSISYHFWARKLRPSFEEPEYNNDFANWAYTKLHDNKLAEQLSLINPSAFPNIEDIRARIIEVLDTRIEESDLLGNSKENEKFQFTRSQIVLFDTEIIVNKPEDLSDLIDELSLGSIYYHFINSKESTTSWLSQFGEECNNLTRQISSIDPYFFSLHELQTKVSQIFKGAKN